MLNAIEPIVPGYKKRREEQPGRGTKKASKEAKAALSNYFASQQYKDDCIAALKVRAKKIMEEQDEKYSKILTCKDKDIYDKFKVYIEIYAKYLYSCVENAAPHENDSEDSDLFLYVEVISKVFNFLT